MENTQAVLRKKLYSTIAAAALMALILGQRHAGFMLYLAIIPLAIWIPYSVVVMVRKPERRLLQLALVSCWVLAVLLVAGIHYFRHEATRRNADDIVAAIKEFKTKRGSYPLTLDEVGIGRTALKDKLGSFSGYNRDVVGTPALFYAATWIVFDTYEYDFRTDSWVYRG